MKKFGFLLILSALLMLSACSGEEGSIETTGTEAPMTEAETTSLIAVEPATVTVMNPGWGFPAHSIEIENPDIVSAELVKSSWNVNVTSHHVGETEIAVLDCFGHKATINVKVTEDGNISYEAKGCEEEFIGAAQNGIVGSKTSTNLVDQTSKLQSLINKTAQNGGGTIFIYPGFYNISLICMRENVTLKMYSGFTDAREGYTPELAEKVKNGEVTVLMVTRIISTDFKDYGRNSACNFTLSGGVIDNNHSTQSTLLFGLSENIVIENMVFKDIKNNHVIQITGSDNVTIRNCIFAGFEWGGTFTRETIQIEQSHPGSHSGDHANAPQRFDYGEMYGCNNIVIDSCYFGPSDELPGAHIAIGHHGTAHEPIVDNFKITNNVFDRPTYAAIRFANIVNVEITGNKFTADKDSNKFCDETNPAFIILYSNTSTITYENIVNGQKVTKAIAEEQSGSHNVNISNNEFTVEKGSDKKIIVATGTNIVPGAVYKAGILRQDTYDSKPYKLAGYLRSTNYISDILFTNNKVTYSGQSTSKDSAFSFTRVFDLSFENNDIQMTDCSFKYEANGINGLHLSNCKSGVEAQTYTVSSQTGKGTIILKNSDGSAAQLKFSISAKHTIVAETGGRIEITQDTSGNVTFTPVAKDGYTFVGWVDASGKSVAAGSITVSEQSTFTAKFTKN